MSLLNQKNNWLPGLIGIVVGFLVMLVAGYVAHNNHNKIWLYISLLGFVTVIIIFLNIWRDYDLKHLYRDNPENSPVRKREDKPDDLN
jgi:hypothetical protein